MRSWWSLEAACKIYAYLEHWFDLSDGVGQGDAALGRTLCVSLRKTGPLVISKINSSSIEGAHDGESGHEEE